MRNSPYLDQPTRSLDHVLKERDQDSSPAPSSKNPFSRQYFLRHRIGLLGGGLLFICAFATAVYFAFFPAPVGKEEMNASLDKGIDTQMNPGEITASDIKRLNQISPAAGGAQD